MGRADPATLWKGTLAASVDGGRNVIINSEGLFAAGVPDELLRQPWHGRPLGNGGVRADIAGVDSICGLAPIGKDTQIDRGLNVASCLPASLIQVERHAATGKQALITLAGVVLAIVVASVLLKLLVRDGEPFVAAVAVASESADGPARADVLGASADQTIEPDGDAAQIETDVVDAVAAEDIRADAAIADTDEAEEPSAGCHGHGRRQHRCS